MMEETNPGLEGMDYADFAQVGRGILDSIAEDNTIPSELMVLVKAAVREGDAAYVRIGRAVVQEMASEEPDIITAILAALAAPSAN